MANFLYCQEIIIFNKTDIQKLQEIENRAYRHILQVPTYTAIEFLHGEVGSSSMITRDMKSKIMYTKHALTTRNNDLLNHVIRSEIERKESTWITTVIKYLDMLKINFNDVMNKNKNEIIKILNDFDNLEWKEKMINKSTLSLYSQYKLNIEQESW